MVKLIEQWVERCPCSPYWRTKTGLIVGSGIVGGLLGAAIVWTTAVPPKLWLEFDWLAATYVLKGSEIQFVGHYEVNRACVKKVLWRVAVLGTSSEVVAEYVPTTEPPDVRLGRHLYEYTMALGRPINPDGWRALVIATCTDLPQVTTISPSPLVEIIVEDGGVMPGIP